VAIGLAATLLLARNAEAATKIMPLGDSLTGGPGCWRALLWTSLQTAGYTAIDFVGTLPGGGCGVATWDGDNEGHGGYLAINVANQSMLPGWLTATNPNIVMMTFGTNDVWNARPTADIIAAFGTLVDQMRQNNPSMRIFVAQIPPVAPPGCSYCQQGTINLNNAIPAWAASKTTAQSPITVVDQWTGWDPVADTTDGVHQSDAGNRKMAAKWYAALTPVLGGSSGTAPSAPSGLTAAASANGIVTLSWVDNAGNETAFAIERKTGASGTYAQIATVAANVTSYQNSGLASGTTYVYRVRASNSYGSSPYSSEASATVPTSTGTAPSAPSGLTATAAAGGIVTLSWVDNAGNETAFAIERKTGASGTYAQIATVAANVTSYQNSGLASATTYVYRVRASNSYGSSSYTSEVSVTTPASTGTGCTCAVGCSSATTVAPPFTKDGVGESCLVSASLGSYVNSWNLSTLDINGANLTNKWANSSGWPAAINGKYYIYYRSTVAWGHFEAK
jgi:lysophospholipase L1-like esterase